MASVHPLPPGTPTADASAESASSGTRARADAAGELAVEYLGLADALARHFRCRGHDPEDLRQVARLGLLKAARRYRADIGHGFVPYAVPTITGELKRYLRDQSWAVRPPRGIQELRLKVNAARPRLAQALGHEPTTIELSCELHVAPAEVAEAQIADLLLVPEAIGPTEEREDGEGRRAAIVLAAEESGFERVESLDALARALEGASQEDLELLRLRFGLELTQEEIAQRLGVSQMQVSRLLRSLLARLRGRMSA